MLFSDTDAGAEAELVKAMWDEAEVAADATNRRVRVRVPLHADIMLEVDASADQYPAHQRPYVSVVRGPNAVINAELERDLRGFIAHLPDGVPMMTDVVVHAFTLSEDIQESILAESAAMRRAQDERRAAKAEHDDGGDDDDDAAPQYLKNFDLFRGEAISDRKSKFVAHVARVRSMDRIREVLAVLRSRSKIAAAAHPAIYAFTYTDAAGTRHSDCDDDGETGAARKMMFLLDQLKAENCLVVVTRWFGGILLGPDRFKHIATVTREALVNSGVCKG